MDEIEKFLAILKKYILALIIVPLVTLIITYFLVKNLADSYVSQAQIATGIVDETRQYQQQSLLNQVVLQPQQVSQEFSNLISGMQQKKILDQVSYKLILHDLQSSKPFKKPSKMFLDLNAAAKAHAISTYSTLHSQMKELNLYNPDQNGLHTLLKTMGYDNENLSRKLAIFRAGDSDFINVQFESPDPELSAFVVNTLSQEFISYYSSLVKTNQVKSTDFLAELVRAKSDTLSKKMAELRNYKIKNRVLNLDEQSKQLYANIIEYDTKKQDAVQTTSSYAGALNEIERKFSPNERRYLEATISKVNQNIVSTKSELSALYDLYYANDFEDRYKVSIDSLQRELSAEIAESSDQYLTSPLATKQALVEERIGLEVKMDLSRYSINSLERQLDKLNAQFDQLVPREAEVQTYSMNIDIATKEYLDILNKYNQSTLESSIPVKLNIVQSGMPGLAQPSKKMLLVILSAIISGFFVILVLFILFLRDRSIISAEVLANKTKSPVLGDVSTLDIPSIDLRRIWQNEELSSHEQVFKNQLRSIRYEIENDMKGKVLLINSLDGKEGKTFLTLSLAFAWATTNKRILVIDGNFKNPQISGIANTDLYIEDFFRGEELDMRIMNDTPMVLLKNRGGDSSLMEIADYEKISERLNWAKRFFDLIIIETASLSTINQSKEWLSFADKIVGVFKYGQSFSAAKKRYFSVLNQHDKFIGWIFNKVPSK